MKTITSLGLAFMVVLLPAVAYAQPEPDKQADAAPLPKLATEMRAAALKLTWTVEGGYKVNALGAFVSKDGPAFIDLSSLVWNEKPTAVTADGTPLKLGRVLGLFPKADLALMKLEHHPETWMEFAEKELEEGDVAAVVVTDSLNKTILSLHFPLP
jgi:hypothetical protein